ncbi:MAG TPA: hypothetical protein VFG59_04265 [Anaeromyxobacter sp.]|nr:hypothetical protein [Anaeromyxobacter sp.]
MNAALHPAETSRTTFHALARLVERITPWLVAVGSWAFGGLIALNLVFLAALVTVGPADRAVLIGATAFACALPFDVAGLVLLRLTRELGEIRVDALALESFQSARFPRIEAYFPSARHRRSLSRRTVRIALAYASAIAALSVALTLAGLAASLWHMASWAGEIFLATVALSALTLIAVAAHSLPPRSEVEKRLNPGEVGR